MKNLIVEVTFDFNDQNVVEKEIFLDFLSTENWIKNDHDNNWKIGFKEKLSTEEKIQIIKYDLEIASKISNIKAVDYAIILNDAVYIDSI